MANVGTAAAGKTLIGAGNGASPTFADIGTNSGLLSNGIIIGQGNGAFQAITAGTTGQLLAASTSGPPFWLASSTTGNLLIANTGSSPGWASTLAGSFTLSKSNSGADISMNVINTSNTSSSTATSLVQVGGSTAADPMSQWIINGVTTFTAGLDNSDSDAWVLAASNALGTTNVIRASTTGVLSYPLQPCVMAYNDTSSSNNTGDGTLYTLIFGTERFDQANNFNGTSTFTAPATGKYLFNCTVLFQNCIATNTLTLQLATTAITYSFGNTGGTIAGNEPMSFSVIADMTAADTATVIASASGGTKTVGIYGNTGDPRTMLSIVKVA